MPARGRAVVGNGRDRIQLRPRSQIRQSRAAGSGRDRLQLRPRSQQIRRSRAAGSGRDSASDDSSSGGEWCAYDDSGREPSPPAQCALATPRTLGGGREPPVQPHDDHRVTTDFTDHGVQLPAQVTEDS